MSLVTFSGIQLLPDHPTLEICTSFKGLIHDASLQQKGVKVSADKLTTNDVTEKKASESVKIKILSTFLPASAFLPVHAEFRSLCPVALTGTDRYGRSFGAWGAMVVLLRWRRGMRQRSKGMVIGRGLRREKK